MQRASTLVGLLSLGGLSLGALALPLACSSGETEIVRVIKAPIGDDPGTGGDQGGEGGAGPAPSTGGRGGNQGAGGSPMSGAGGSPGGGGRGGQGGGTGGSSGGADAGMGSPIDAAANGGNEDMGGNAVPDAAEPEGPFKVLVFTKTAGFKHSSIPFGVQMMRDLAKDNNFEVTVTDDANFLTDDNMEPFTVLFFMNTTDDILNNNQQAVVERFLKKGRGFAGVHAATDTEDSGGWPWYGEVVGSFYTVHGPSNEAGTLRVDPGAANHPACKHLPMLWNRSDEWYQFRRNVTGLAGVQVLLRFSTDSRPMAWTREYDGVRAFYTALGHTNASYSEPHFRNHVLGGLLWAANRVK